MNTYDDYDDFKNILIRDILTQETRGHVLKHLLISSTDLDNILRKIDKNYLKNLKDLRETSTKYMMRFLNEDGYVRIDNTIINCIKTTTEMQNILGKNIVCYIFKGYYYIKKDELFWVKLSA